MIWNNSRSTKWNIDEGSSIVFVENDKQPIEVKVTKVGRIWLTLENGQRVDIESGKLECGNGECFESLKDHDDHQLYRGWEKLKWFIKESEGYYGPKGITIEQIRQAMTLFNFKV